MDDDRIVHGPAVPTGFLLNDGNVLCAETLSKYAKKHLDSVFMVDAVSGEELHIRTVLTKSKILAAKLQSLGCKPGRVVGIICENRNEYFIILLAIWFTGATAACFSHIYSPRELEHTLSIAKPYLIFTNAQASEQMQKVKPSIKIFKYTVQLDSNHVNKAEIGTLDYANMVEGPSVEHELNSPNLTADSLALILFSSGSTGLPKAVMFSNRDLIQVSQYFRYIYQNLTDMKTNVTLLVLPFFHCYGFSLLINFFTTGGTIVYLSRFDQNQFLSAIERYKVTALPLVPTLMSFLAKHPSVDKYDLSSVEEILCGAAPLSIKLENEVKSRLKLSRIQKGYAMTEVWFICSTWFAPYKPGTVGRLSLGMSAKVVDEETGQILGPNQRGELCFKGLFTTKGYHGDEEETKKIIDEDGWLHSGDVGYYDKDGDFFIVDRIKDIIKFKGFQVAPTELESLLMLHEAVADAAVIGVPDKEAGEVPKAFVVKCKEVTESELLKYVADNVAPQMKLRGGITFMDQIPRNPSGKILRKSLRMQIKSKL